MILSIQKLLKIFFFEYKNLYTSRQVLYEIDSFINSLPLNNREEVKEYLKESLFKLLKTLYIIPEDSGDIKDLVNTVLEYKNIASSIFDEIEWN